MAGKQRRQSQGEGRPSSSSGSGSGSGAGGRPTATVFRKSTKKARLDEASPNTHAKKPLPGKAAGVAEGKPPVKPKPKPPPQRTRPKDQPKPKTKHEFIQQKKAAALAEKEKEKAATAKKVAANAKAKAAKQGPAQKGKGKAGKIKTPAVPPALVIPAPPPPASSFRIVTGSYERLLYGFQASLSPNPSSSPDSNSSALSVNLKPYFIFPAHVSAIKTVACGPDGSRWLATGGTDELIKIWDLKKRVEVGALTGHEGTITSLSFPSRTFLISTGSDGRINIFRARDWALLRTLKGHTGSINSAAVHPSGRLALSVGKDRTIRMWDLMRAKGAASTKLGVEGETIRWDSRGERFVVLSSTGAGEGIVFRTDMTRLHMLEGIKRLHDVQFVRARMSRGGEDATVVVEHELMLVASEDKSVHVFDLDQSALEELEREQMKVKARAESKKGKAEGDVEDEDEDDEEEDDAVPLVEIGRLVGHGNRVKAVAVQHVIVPTAASDPTSTSLSTTLLATTISSDGLIRVFDLARLLHIRSTSSSDSKTVAAEAVPELEAIASHDTKGSRLTCLSIAPGGGKSAAERALADKGKKRALSDDDEEEEDDDDAADAGEEGDPFLDSDVGSESAVDTEDEDDDDDEDEDDVDLEAEAEELARLEKEIEEAKKLGLEIPSDFEEEDDDEDDEDMESFDEDEDEVEGEGEDEGEDEEEE